MTDTREHAMGLYQQAYAAANSARRIAMNAIAKNIDTSSVKLTGGMDETGPGAGVGFQVEASLLPAPVERGMGPSRLYHLFNACAFDRHELAELTMWDYRADVSAIVVKDAKGNTVPHQVLESGHNQYWGHDFVRLLVDAKVPAMAMPPTWWSRARRRFNRSLAWRSPGGHPGELDHRKRIPVCMLRPGQNAGRR